MRGTFNSSNAETLSPIIFYYFDINGTDAFIRMLKERFRQTGSRRPIVFREWDCYETLPGEDGDLFAYDGVVLSALASKGLLMPLPDELTADGVFPWVLEKSKYWNKTFGIPFIMCSNALICRKKDAQDIRGIIDLHEPVAIPIQSMLMFYFIQALCSNRDLHRSMKVMDHLLDLIGVRDFLTESDSGDYDGVDRFNREECRYLLGFTEDIMSCKNDRYTVRFEDFSNSRKSRQTLFMVDFVSVAKHVRGEKLRDCLTLLKIMVDEQFTYDLCTADGRLQYLLPANMRVFPRLAELDPLYDELFSLLESGNNGLLRYGRRYYEDFNRQESLLFQLLCEKAGWKLDGAGGETVFPEASEKDANRMERLRKCSSYFCGRKRSAHTLLQTSPEGLLRFDPPKCL